MTFTEVPEIIDPSPFTPEPVSPTTTAPEAPAVIDPEVVVTSPAPPARPEPSQSPGPEVTVPAGSDNTARWIAGGFFLALSLVLFGVSAVGFRRNRSA